MEMSITIARNVRRYETIKVEVPESLGAHLAEISARAELGDRDAVEELAGAAGEYAVAWGNDDFDTCEDDSPAAWIND